MRVKKCAQCNSNSFAVLVDTQISVACQSCGHVYQQHIIKRLPDDTEAMRNMRISLSPVTTKELVYVIPK